MIHTGPVRRPVPALLVAALLIAGAACSAEDGRVLPEPEAHQLTTTSTSTAPSLDGGGSLTEVFSLSSTAFAPGMPIPVQHTCDAQDISPPLAWASTPPAAELALVVRDPDAGGAVHWIVTGIDPLVQGLGEGGVPEGAMVHVNDFGEAAWRGPCPPEGETHTYELALHALPEELPLPALSVPAPEIVAQIEQSASATAVLTGTYGR